MIDDDAEVRAFLQNDARALARTATLPTARQALWRATLHRSRRRSSQVARLVSVVTAVSLGIPAIVLTAIAWQTVVPTPAANHVLTLGAVTATTILVIAVLSAVPLAARRE